MNSLSSLHYRLCSERGVPVVLRESTYDVPLTTADDYARIAAYQPNENAPVLLDHAQYFEFLSELVEAFWGALGEDARLFIQLRAPYLDSLPANLLDARVLLGTALGAQLAYWASHESRPALAITDRIRRDLDYPGDNTLTCMASDLRWLEAADAALARSWPRYALRISPISNRTGA
jgi:hypothetical protein